MDYDDLLAQGMTPEEMLSEGLVDIMDFPYEPLGNGDDKDATYYGDVKDLDDDEDEIRF